MKARENAFISSVISNKETGAMLLSIAGVLNMAFSPVVIIKDIKSSEKLTSHRCLIAAKDLSGAICSQRKSMAIASHIISIPSNTQLVATSCVYVQ